MSKIALRKAWFQVHKWIGLVLAVLIIPISLTGSALVWHEPIERMLHPERQASGPMALPLTAYIDAARAVLQPGEQLSRLDHVGVVKVAAVRPGKGMPQRATIYLDPASARVLGVERNNEGLFRVFHNLHGSLMVPGAGRQIVGWVGVAMLISSLTGLWLWWPLSGSVRRGFRWKRHRNTDTNLHHLVGFWVALPLFILSLTGVWISFPQVFGPGQRPPERGAASALGQFAPFEEALELAQSAEMPIRSFVWPTDQNPKWSIEYASKDGTRPFLTLDTTNGVPKFVEDISGQPETLARTMRRIHDGTGMGFFWQLILFLAGIIPAILAATGIIMWWRAREWRGAVRR